MVIQYKHVNRPTNMYNRVKQNLNLIRNLKFLVKIQNIKIRILALTPKPRNCIPFKYDSNEVIVEFTECHFSYQHFHQASKTSPFTDPLKANRLLNGRIIINLKTAEKKEKMQYPSRFAEENASWKVD